MLGGPPLTLAMATRDCPDLPLELWLVEIARRLDIVALLRLSRVAQRFTCFPTLRPVLSPYHGSMLTDVFLLSGRLPRIDTLVLQGMNARATGTGVASLVHLTTLDISHGNTSIASAALRRLTNLTSLDLYDNQYISDTGIAGLVKLTTLRIRHATRVSDAGIAGLVNLTTLDASHNERITDAGIVGLVNLTSLNITPVFRCFSRITGAGLAPLVNLQTLCLQDHPTVADEDLRPLVNLTALDVYGNKTITGAGLALLPNLTCVWLFCEADRRRLNLVNNTRITILSR